MIEEWEFENQKMVIQGRSPHNRILALFKKELRGLFPWIAAGFLFSVMWVFVCSYLIGALAENYSQVLVLGFSLSLVGLGILGSQLILTYDGIHHTVFRQTRLVPKIRRILPLLAFSFASYLLLFFLPYDSVYVWNNPVVSSVDTILIIVFGACTPYIAKVCYDYIPISEHGERKIWRAALGLVAVILVLSNVASLSVLPNNVSISVILRQTALSVASLLGILYTFKLSLGGQREGPSFVEEQPENRIDDVLYGIYRNKKISFAAGTVAGIGLPFLAGSMAAINAGLDPSPVGIGPGTFIILGYPTLLLYGWVFVFGPVILSMSLFGIGTVAVFAAEKISIGKRE